MSVVCQIDQSVHEDVTALHAHLRRFRVKQADYYEHHFPRQNVATGAAIRYKTHDQYFNQDLQDKNELKSWIKREPEKAKEWAINWLKKRREEKGLTYAPSQAELKTLLCPTMIYYNSIGGYYNICRELGYQDRYDDELLKFVTLPKDAMIIQDTREQNALKLAAPTKIATVSEGDYALAPPNDKGVYIERKSLNDFCSSVCKGNARLRRELERATKKGYYIVMLVEDTIANAQSIEYLPHTRHIKASSSFIAKQMRDLLTDFPFSFQVLFIDGRIEAAQKLIKIFELGEQVKTVDLQWKYERGEL